MKKERKGRNGAKKKTFTQILYISTTSSREGKKYMIHHGYLYECERYNNIGKGE